MNQNTDARQQAETGPGQAAAGPSGRRARRPAGTGTAGEAWVVAGVVVVVVARPPSGPPWPPGRSAGPAAGGRGQQRVPDRDGHGDPPVADQPDPGERHAGRRGHLVRGGASQLVVLAVLVLVIARRLPGRARSPGCRRSARSSARASEIYARVRQPGGAAVRPGARLPRPVRGDDRGGCDRAEPRPAAPWVCAPVRRSARRSGWDYYSAETAYAVELLQTKLGLTVTGTLPLGQAAFLPGPALVTGAGHQHVAGRPGRVRDRGADRDLDHPDGDR